MTENLPAEARVGRVALRVADPEPVAEFYTTVVGLDVLDRTPDRTTLGVEETPLLVLLSAPEAPERADDAAGLFHLALRVPTRAALGAALDRLESDWRLTGASDHHVSEALYTRDPAGNGLEVYVDRPREEWPETDDGHVAMDTLPLDREGLREAAREGVDAVTLPPETDVGHVHLETTDVDRAVAFYESVVGLRVRQRIGGDAVFLAAGDYHHHVGVNAWGKRRSPADDERLGLAWYEFVVPETAALDALRGRLTDANVDVRNAEREGGQADAGESLAVTDPDGITVRFRVASAIGDSTGGDHRPRG
ncbi:VOC family protein [Halorubrum gandharaense]